MSENTGAVARLQGKKILTKPCRLPITKTDIRGRSQKLHKTM